MPPEPIIVPFQPEIDPDPGDVDATLHGHGAIQSPPDPRDYELAAAVEPIDRTFPARYVVAGMPAVLDQGVSPQCVAFSTSATKGWHDRRDQGKFFNFNEGRFFLNIGGTSAGAYMRRALDELRADGYPVVATNPDPAHHKITAYYAVPRAVADLKAAITDHGPVLVISPWYHSWHRPVNGVLPKADYQTGGHAYVFYGWDDAKGFRIRNSWGTDWGLGGDAFMPYGYLSILWEAWVTIDQVVDPIAYVHTVAAISTGVKIRKAPTPSAAQVGFLKPGTRVKTTKLRRYGGAYEGPTGKRRTDWLAFTRNGATVWIARAYTKLVS